MFYGTSCVIIKSCVSPRVIRYLDITLGLLLLISMLSLLYGSYSLHPILLVIFFTLSLTVLVAYWIWYLYTNFIASHYPMFEEQVGAVHIFKIIDINTSLPFYAKIWIL